MKKKLRGLKQRDIQLDFNLYRVEVPIRGLSDMALSVIDIWPEGAEKTLVSYMAMPVAPKHGNTRSTTSCMRIVLWCLIYAGTVKVMLPLASTPCRNW